MSKYLMKGAAAFVIGMAATACSHDFDVDANEARQELDNAQATLGFYIPDNQDWVLSSAGTASIAVSGDYGATYEVFIYENNPFIDNTGTVLASGSVVSGQTFNAEFRYATGLTSVFAAIKDEKGYTYVKPAAIVDGKIETNFGESANAARTRGVTRGSAADDFVIPTYTQPDFSAYINDATPITAENNTTDPSNTVRHYVIPAGTTWSDFIPLIQASDPNSTDVVSVYVLGTLNVNAEQRINGGYGGAYKLIVGNGGVVNIANGVTLTSNANQGSGNVGEIHILAGGTIQGEGKLQFANGTNSYNYNAGKIDVGTLNNNGGTLYNVGTIEADVLEGGAGLSIYINAGKVHIGKCVRGSSTANTRILNNCWWEVDEELYCRNIVQGAGAYIKADDLGMSGSEDGTGDASYIYVKDNSLIEITNYVAFNGVDIVGPTGDNYAYLQFGAATGRTSDQGWGSDELGIAMNLEGEKWVDGTRYYANPILNNIRMSVDRPEVQTNMYSQTAYQMLLNALNGTRSCTYALDPYGPDSEHPEWATMKEWPVQGNGNAILVNKNQYTTATVSESDCSPGITVVPPTPVENTNKTWTYAFEDNRARCDFDLNDVVLQVKQNDSDASKLDVTLVAAGCEYDNYVFLGTTRIEWAGGAEVHDAFGVNRGQMVNTGRGVTAAAVTTTISKPSGFDFQNADFKIMPYKTNSDYNDATARLETNYIGIAGLDNNVHKAPIGIVIPTKWKWPRERCIITDAYSGFAEWGSEPDVTTRATLATWYENPVTNNVISQ